MKWRERIWWEVERCRELLTTPGGSVSRWSLLLRRRLRAHYATHPAGRRLEASVSVLAPSCMIQAEIVRLLRGRRGGTTTYSTANSTATARNSRDSLEGCKWRRASAGADQIVIEE